MLIAPPHTHTTRHVYQQSQAIEIAAGHAQTTKPAQRQSQKKEGTQW
jgi:hypothetical protein